MYGHLAHHTKNLNGGFMAAALEVASSLTKSGRLEARVSRKLKQLFQQAADIHGITLTDFVINSAQEAATRAVQEQNMMKLSARDRAVLVNALLHPPEPSPRLRAAYAHYKKTFLR